MGLCKLCLKREANDSGSHVIPYFLIKDMLHTGDGKVARDKEFSFTLGVAQTQSYIGRSVLREEVKRFIGTDYDPEELAKEQNPYTVDWVWCKQCESGFTAVEDYYAKKAAFLERDGVLTNRCPVPISTLFWCSVIWRAAVTDFGEVQLRTSDIEPMRKLLSDTLERMKGISNESLDYIANAVKESGYCYQLLVTKNSEDIPLIFLDDELYNPSTLIINGRIILWYPLGLKGLTEGSSVIPCVPDFIRRCIQLANATPPFLVML